MRTAGVLLGAASIVAYAVFGALLMNDWAVTAASGLPLDDTIAAMSAADQPYSTTPGVVFAAIGCTLALVWAVVTLILKIRFSGWIPVAAWAGILAFGALAFFFASFANMNSVGDTFFEWNAAAAFTLEAPLYVASGVAAIIAVIATVFAVVSRKPHRSPQVP